MQIIVILDLVLNAWFGGFLGFCFIFLRKRVARLQRLLLTNPQYPSQVTRRSGPIVASVLTRCPRWAVLHQVA